MGFFTGFSIALPPGPAAIEALNRSIAKGFFSGIKVSLGAVFGDFTLLIIINLGLLKFLVNNPTRVGVFWILSGILLMVFAYFNNKGNGESKLLSKISSNPRLGGFFSGFMMTILNPTSISLWIALSSTVFTLWLDKGMFCFLSSLCSMFLGSLTWLTILNIFASKGVKLLKKDISKAATKLLSIVLLLIGTGFIILGILNFFS